VPFRVAGPADSAVLLSFQSPESTEAHEVPLLRTTKREIRLHESVCKLLTSQKVSHGSSEA
jgi:hypothetical protein